MHPDNESVIISGGEERGYVPRKIVAVSDRLWLVKHMSSLYHSLQEDNIGELFM